MFIENGQKMSDKIFRSFNCKEPSVVPGFAAGIVQRVQGPLIKFIK